ncbi:hypothetical protein F5984_18800 [Rudanella paleaurantiibacter]|uniref:Pectate lyase superfamily protein domain-containing protein n=1 Tax=Rudanella paleaurantiibacter TaxID=2614655 RepID=A0A7J5TXX5_9BACT|nr:hypothetical protein [Rudanella paleaurantiibacter]KAB7728421.1 hypothetical protein F5984_18800 [Rudanella paleaurantiibacter]
MSLTSRIKAGFQAAGQRVKQIEDTSYGQSVSRFGAVGDGIAIENQAYNQALQNQFEKALWIPKKTYKFNQGITLDISKVRLMGERCVFDFTEMTTGTAVTIIGAGTGNPYANGVNCLDFIRIVGPGKNSEVKGVVLSTGTEGGTSHFALNNFVVSGFGINIEIGDNAYLQKCHQSSSYDGGIGVHVPNGANSGENICLNQIAVFNCKKGIVSANGNADLYLYGCSLDYNERQIETTGALIEMHGGHIEGKNYISAPIYLNGSGAHFKIFGGRIVNTENQTIPEFFVECQNGASGKFANTDIHNIGYSSGYFAGGNSAEKVTVTDPTSYEVYNAFLLISSKRNVLNDGTFEGATISDAWFVSGTGSRASRTRMNSGDGNAEVEISKSSERARTGTKSLKFFKRWGGGSGAVMSLIIPVTPGTQLVGQLFLSNGNSTGTLYIGYSFAAGFKNNFDDPFHRKEPAGVDAVNMSTIGSVWNKRTTGGNPLRVPCWAKYVVIDFNADGLGPGSGSFFVDDIEFNSLGENSGSEIIL